MESNTLFCVFCSNNLGEEATYCASCSEYKGVMTYEDIVKHYPELAKELVESNDLEEYFEWLNTGFTNKWITPPFCMTHDGDPYLTEQESNDWEEGGDPCAHVVKLALETDYYKENPNG